MAVMPMARAELPTNERPEWLTLDQIKEYRSSMLKKRAEQENKA